MLATPTARTTAFDLLTSVLRRRRPLDECLEASAGLRGLDERDRAFARLLVVTTLRRLGQLDALIESCLERPLPRRATAVHDLLRLGVCQLLFLATPAHAAVSTTVDLTRAGGHSVHVRLVNAVLRRLDREGRAAVAAQDAARLDTPDWLWESWRAAYGEAAGRAIAQAHLGEPPLDITVKENPAAWAERLGATVLPNGTLRRPVGGAVAELPGYGEGAWWVQDAAASLPARLLGPVAGRRVADLCAAPGGKTAQLAAAGALVTAVERSPRRLERLSANLARLGLDARAVAADAAELRPEEPYDAILLDAPCTATGTLRRHPDIAHLKSPQDVAALAAAQDRLLRAAVAALRPGGLLVYCVCSLQPEEGEARIAALLAEQAPVARVPVSPEEVGGLAEAVTAAGDLRTLPCHWAERGGMDGFYAARLRRL